VQLSREKLVVGASLLGLALVSWFVTAAGSSKMMGMPSFPVDTLSLTAFALTWAVGMIAMMFPTTVPMMLLFLNVGKRSSAEIRAGGGPTPSKALVFATSYLAIWVATGVLIYLATASVFSFIPGDYVMSIGTPLGLGIALILLGVYQFSPTKTDCLSRCHPTAFLYRYYQGGQFGAAKMGLQYAKYCVGCCWVMMVFLLIVASMGVLWMALFAGIIFAERTLSNRSWSPKIAGAGFLASGVLIATLLR
jgi:predicted metal-binding membrane protein